jgi:hypothetical protein
MNLAIMIVIVIGKRIIETLQGKTNARNELSVAN